MIQINKFIWFCPKKKNILQWRTNRHKNALHRHPEILHDWGNAFPDCKCSRPKRTKRTPNSDQSNDKEENKSDLHESDKKLPSDVPYGLLSIFKPLDDDRHDAVERKLEVIPVEQRRTAPGALGGIQFFIARRKTVNNLYFHIYPQSPKIYHSTTGWFYCLIEQKCLFNPLEVSV